MGGLEGFEAGVQAGSMVEVSGASEFQRIFSEMGFDGDDCKKMGDALNEVLENDRGKAYYRIEVKRLNVEFLFGEEGRLDLEINEKGDVVPVSVGLIEENGQKAGLALSGTLKDIKLHYPEVGFPTLVLSSDEGGELEISWYSDSISVHLGKGWGHFHLS